MDNSKITRSLVDSVRAMSMPNLHMPEIRIPPNPLIEMAKDNCASEFYKRLAKWIEDFDAALDNDHEVGVRLVSFGQTIIFYLTGMGYWNPSLMSFQGVTQDGSPVELIQHVTQISVLLMKLPRKDPSQPKKPFGFATGINEEPEEK